jgi:hypothetical protein
MSLPRALILPADHTHDIDCWSQPSRQVNASGTPIISSTPCAQYQSWPILDLGHAQDAEQATFTMFG